jgi:hypothetical protein
METGTEHSLSLFLAMSLNKAAQLTERLFFSFAPGELQYQDRDPSVFIFPEDSW